MNERFIGFLRDRPALYANSTSAFWDDEHISKAMLSAHLSPNTDAASRKPDFMTRSAAWIASVCPKGGALLDLGCGPGLYAELFDSHGLHVTGVDLSHRSIDYAKNSAAQKGLAIDYRRMNYLDVAFDGEFDAVTIIYCDLGVLSPAQRSVLLSNALRALKPGGRLILDGWLPSYMDTEFSSTRETTYSNGGFWSPKPYVCVQSGYYYPDTMNFVEQYVVVTDDDCQCYNIWNQLYTPDTLRQELTAAGFAVEAFFDDVTGAPFTGKGITLCAMARKI